MRLPLADLQATDYQDALAFREPPHILSFRTHRAYAEPVCALDLLTVGAAPPRVDRDANAGHGHALAGVPLLWVRPKISDDLNAQHDELLNQSHDGTCIPGRSRACGFHLGFGLVLVGHHYTRITEPVDDARPSPSFSRSARISGVGLCSIAARSADHLPRADLAHIRDGDLSVCHARAPR